MAETRDPLRSAVRTGAAPLALTLVLALLLGAVARPQIGTAQPSQPPRGGPTPVPVTVATATRETVPVTLRGLGIVQAFNAVTIKPRVDGTLMEVKVKEGQEVRKGELLAVIDPRPYQAALDAVMAKKSQDEAQMANAQRDLARYTSLAQRDFASRQQVETQQATVAGLTAALKGDDASVATAQLNLSFCYLLSPIDGRAGFRQVDPGNLVRSSDSGGIISIAQLHPISVVFTLPQDTLYRITQAMASRRLPVRAYTGDEKTELAAGELLTPDNAIDTSTGTIRLKATFPNLDNRLWPGQFVSAQLLVEERRDVLTVPSQAVQHGPAGLYAYVVKPDSTVARQELQIDQDTGSVAVVTQGVQAGDRVVVSGQSRLQNGLRVAAEEGSPASAVPAPGAQAPGPSARGG